MEIRKKLFAKEVGPGMGGMGRGKLFLLLPLEYSLTFLMCIITLVETELNFKMMQSTAPGPR